MAWIYLAFAGGFEVVWAIALKYSHGFTKLVPTLITLAGMAVSFYLLAQATKTLPIGTAYAVWTGIGTVGAAVLGVVLFHEALTLPRVMFLCMIVVGILGLKFTSS